MLVLADPPQWPEAARRSRAGQGIVRGRKIPICPIEGIPMMRVVLTAVTVVLLTASTAVGGRVYRSRVVVPAAPVMVHSFYPVGPVYAYPEPVYMAPVAPVVYGPAPVYYTPGVTVRSKVYVHGQPVRNTIRAVLP